MGKKTPDFVAKAGLFPYNSGPRKDQPLSKAHIKHSLPSGCYPQYRKD